jgi:broad-specificity NMP kinase
LLALVVRGRPGTGKSSAVRAIAHEMEIDLQECGNEFNQTKYLKEKNESTQS